MSSVQMNVMKADVWWVTCQLCDYTTPQSTDQDTTEELRRAHHRTHDGNCPSSHPDGPPCDQVRGHDGPHTHALAWHEPSKAGWGGIRP